VLVFLLGLIWFVRHGGFSAPREASPYLGPAEPDSDSTAEPDEVTADE
jgi:hypothetical protein